MENKQPSARRLPFATHRFELDEMIEAYDTFADAAATNALKVVLTGHPAHLPAGEKAVAATAEHAPHHVERVCGRARRAASGRDGAAAPHQGVRSAPWA
jgi:hypothetical protein